MFNPKTNKFSFATSECYCFVQLKQHLDFGVGPKGEVGPRVSTISKWLGKLSPSLRGHPRNRGIEWRVHTDPHGKRGGRGHVIIPAGLSFPRAPVAPGPKIPGSGEQNIAREAEVPYESTLSGPTVFEPEEPDDLLEPSDFDPAKTGDLFELPDDDFFWRRAPGYQNFWGGNGGGSGSSGVGFVKRDAALDGGGLEEAEAQAIKLRAPGRGP
ncbi:hypothetical protein TWF730_009836 [Orbilia blumenaviensis]|uniref:Uncharacterized protein n=1 Tax=Orbilia blumenaviensis TaxID=1796055 RepID=A0AAV9UT12_9PEZI